MKKIYMQPETAVVKIELTTLIAPSLLYDPSQQVEGNNDIGTKGRVDWDIWDEEDEE